MKTYVFSLVLQGSMQLQAGESAAIALNACDAFVIPAGMTQQFDRCSADWELLQVFMPGAS